MEENIKKVADYYQDCDEDSRMAENPLEYMRCKEIISRYLSKNCMDILDIGGATGAFSFWLAEQGHDVSLIDLAAKHIETAGMREKEKRIKLSSLAVGDARELPYKDKSFDIALLMGPLYHLINRSDRIQAVKEARRVLRPGGIMICEVISRYASMVDGFVSGLVNDREFCSIMKKDIETGLHVDTSGSKKYFTDSYFHRPEEVSREITEGGFEFNELISVTGFGCAISDINEKLKDNNYRRLLLETIRTVEKEPSLMGISSHYIGIGIRPVM